MPRHGEKPVKRAIGLSLAVALLIAGLATALGNDFRDAPFDQKVRAADLVIIGRVVSTQESPRYAGIHATTVLKGTPPETIRFVVQAGISEMDPHCCTEVGRSYLFFLRREKDGTFGSV